MIFIYILVILLLLYLQYDYIWEVGCMVAREIFGMEDVKKAVLLLVVGGVEQAPADMKIQGNINVGIKSHLMSHTLI